MFDTLATFISSESGSTGLLVLAIIACAFIFEDITTIVVGILAAEGYLGVPLALASLYVGILLGDAALYTLGWIARTHPRLAHYIDHDFTTSFRGWLEKRYLSIIFCGHFVPGLRFTTYVASGFFRRPLLLYIPTAIAGGLLLGSALFTLAYWFGSVTSEWVRPLRWVFVAAFLLTLAFASSRTLRIYRAKSETPG